MKTNIKDRRAGLIISPLWFIYPILGLFLINLGEPWIWILAIVGAAHLRAVGLARKIERT